MKAPARKSDVLRIVEGRLGRSVIKRLSALGLERSEIDEVVIPSRKLQHPSSRREKLTSEESDRQLRIIRVPSSAETAYLGRGGAHWHGSASPSLDWRADPFPALNRDTGSRIAAERLIQIEEGIYPDGAVANQPASGPERNRWTESRREAGRSQLSPLSISARIQLPFCLRSRFTPRRTIFRPTSRPARGRARHRNRDCYGPRFTEDWPARSGATRALGMAWLGRNQRVHLKIPIAIVPWSSNFLLNPLRADASAFRIIEVLRYPFKGGSCLRTLAAGCA